MKTQWQTPGQSHLATGDRLDTMSLYHHQGTRPSDYLQTARKMVRYKSTTSWSTIVRHLLKICDNKLWRWPKPNRYAQRQTDPTSMTTPRILMNTNCTNSLLNRAGGWCDKSFYYVRHNICSFSWLLWQKFWEARLTMTPSSSTVGMTKQCGARLLARLICLRLLYSCRKGLKSQIAVDLSVCWL